MQIKQLFQEDEEITIESYLERCGVEDSDEYINIKGKHLEHYSKYDNMDLLVNQMAIVKDKPISIYILIDTDFDGNSSASMLYIYLKRLNPNFVITPLFHTIKQKAHGIQDKEVFNYVMDNPCDMLFLPDSSSNDTKECRKISEKGVFVVVLDHHEIEQANPHCILINNQLSYSVTNKSGSGCLVTHKFLKAMDDKFGLNYSNDLISYVSISLVSDSMDMRTYENRLYTKYGHNNIHPYLQPFIDEFITKDTINNISIAWNLTNKFNSVIRSDDQKAKEELFMALTGEHDSKEAIRLCKKCHAKQTNETKKLMEKLEPTIDLEKNVLIAITEEQSNYNGLVCNKLCSKYAKPTLILRCKKGQYSGSLRSPYPLKDIINSFDGAEGIGHGSACGVIIEEDKYDEFLEYLEHATSSLEPFREVLISSMVKSLPMELYDLKSSNMELFGKDIPVPTVHIHSININSKLIQKLGANGLTIKFPYEGIDFIHFFTSNELKEKLYMNDTVDMEIEVIGELSWNEFRGVKKPQCIVKEFISIERQIPKEESWEDIFG